MICKLSTDRIEEDGLNNKKHDKKAVPNTMKDEELDEL